jgi:DNA-directed RNA polymerase sigma subunit (sigma70/sigma32)
MPAKLDDDTASLEEIGREFGLTRSRIGQVQIEALARVRLRLVAKLGADAAQALARDEWRSPPITRRSR